MFSSVLASAIVLPGLSFAHNNKPPPISFSEFKALVLAAFYEKAGYETTQKFFATFEDEDWLGFYNGLKTNSHTYHGPISFIKKRILEERAREFRAQLTESWAWSLVRKKIKHLECAFCQAIADYTIRELNDRSLPRPDGLIYEIQGRTLIIHRLMESQSGEASTKKKQALNFLRVLRTQGINVPEGHFDEIHLAKTNLSFSRSLGKVSDDEFLDQYWIWSRNKFVEGFNSRLPIDISNEIVTSEDLDKIGEFIFDKNFQEKFWIVPNCLQRLRFLLAG